MWSYKHEMARLEGIIRNNSDVRITPLSHHINIIGIHRELSGMRTGFYWVWFASTPPNTPKTCDSQDAACDVKIVLDNELWGFYWGTWFPSLSSMRSPHERVTLVATNWVWSRSRHEEKSHLLINNKLYGLAKSELINPQWRPSSISHLVPYSA